MAHLSGNEIALLAEGGAGTAGQRAHLNECAACAARLASAERLERSLEALGRVAPAADLSARILAGLPADVRGPWRPTWPVAAAGAAALLGAALAFQTALDLRAAGGFDLLAVYSAQPDIVRLYPDAALGALSAAVPWATLLASLLALVVALALAARALDNGWSIRAIH